MPGTALLMHPTPGAIAGITTKTPESMLAVFGAENFTANELKLVDVETTFVTAVPDCRC